MEWRLPLPRGELWCGQVLGIVPLSFSVGGVRISRQSLAIGAIVLLAVGLRLYKLDSVPLWTDELFTRFYPDTGLSFMWSEGLRTEPTPPLYYSLVWLIERLFGTSAAALRLPSVAASLAGIGLAAMLAREVFGGSRAALITALLLSVAPANLFLAQEIRSYALQGAALALALLGFARVLRAARHGLLLYAAGAALAIWLHPTSIAVVAGINAAALASAVGRTRLLDRPALLRWIGANAAVAALCLPLVPGLLSGGAATSWIPPLNRYSLERVIGTTLAGPALDAHAYRIAELGVLALAALMLVPPWRPGRRAMTVLAVAPGLAFTLMLVVSLAKPVLLSRTVAWLLIPLAAILGDILSRRPWPVGAAVAAGALAAATVHVIAIDGLKEDWPGLFARMPGLAPPALVVLAPHTPPGALAVYAPQAGAPVRMDDGAPPTPETTVMPRLFGTQTIGKAELEQAVAAGRPVWLIFRRPDYEWAQQEAAALPPPKASVQSEPGSNPAIRALFW